MHGLVRELALQVYKSICNNIFKLGNLLHSTREVVEYIYAPNFEEVEGAYWFGPVRLSVCPSVRLTVCPSVRLSVRPSVRYALCWLSKQENRLT